MAHRPTHRTNGSSSINIETQLQRLLTSPFELTQGLTSEEQAGLETLRQTGDPTTQLEAARGRFEQFTAPEVISRLTAAGFGRSGAVGPSLARAFAPTAASIEQQALANRVGFGQAQIRAGETVAGRADTQRTALLERAIRVLQQIQTLRTSQAQANARASGVSFAPSQATRSFNEAFAQQSQFGRARVAAGASTPFGGFAAPPRVSPNANAFALAQIRANQARIQSDIEGQRATGGAASIFGPPASRPTSGFPVGNIRGGPGFGGTITTTGAPRLRKPLF